MGTAEPPPAPAPLSGGAVAALGGAARAMRRAARMGYRHRRLRARVGGMTAEEIVAARIAPFWLVPERIKGSPPEDSALVMGQRYRKADGKSLTQFNTGAIVIRDDRILALTE